MSLLKLKNLSVNFKNQPKDIKAVKNVSLNLKKGEILAIVGESGSGKTVTALSIMQLLPYPKAYHPKGQIIFEEQDLLKLESDKRRNYRGNKISMIFQEPMTSLNPLHTIEKQISEIITLHNQLSPSKIKEKCLELLDLVELSALKTRLNSYPHELSGGQRQRVMIAMALANNPEILIADEPTTALDVTTQANILKLIKKLQSKLQMSVIIITHDLGIVEKIADRVYVMHQGKIVEHGATSKIFKKPAEEYTKQLINAKPKEKINKATKSKVILKTDNVNVSFPTKKNFFGKTLEAVTAVKDANIAIKKGQTLGIVGESGSGKTTLAMAILRLQKSTGNVVFHEKNIKEFNNENLRKLRKKLQIVFQDPFASLNPRMTIFQIIAEGLIAHNIGNKEGHRKAVAKALKEVGLDKSALDKYPHEFSGGQRQRIAIARTLVLEPEIIILDEPTSALDLSIQCQILDLLITLQNKHGISYIFISHDLKTIKAISHEVIVMKQGKIIESGTTKELFKDPKSKYTKKLINAAFKKIA